MVLSEEMSSSSIIVISSDEDDDYEFGADNNSVDDDILEIIDLPSLSHAVESEDERNSHVKICSMKERGVMVEDYTDDDLPDLPDIAGLNYVPHIGETGRVPEHQIQDIQDNLDTDIPVHSTDEDKEEFISQSTNSLKRHIIGSGDSEPPAKCLKTEEKILEQRMKEISMTENHESVDILRCKIFKSLLVGGMNVKKNRCNFNCSKCSHSGNGQLHCTRVQSRVVYETMFSDENLQIFALRAILQREVSSKQFLCSFTTNLVLQYLFGSEEKMEAPEISGLHLGISILCKQFHLHPPCKPGMRHGYLKMCQDWFIPLLDRIKDVLDNSSCVPESIQPVSENTIEVPDFFDFSDVVRKKAFEKRERFLKRSKQEKIIHLSVLLNFFSSVLQSNASVWYAKHWNCKGTPFRKDISPILSEILWGTTITNFGDVNETVKKIFYIYSNTCKENSLHENLGVLISVTAAILHRRENCLYPEMAPLTRNYARKLYMEIKSSPDLESNLSNLNPDWLTFHVTSLFLGVEEPANFYKVKERISQVLDAKDKGRQCVHSFDVEIVCFQAIKSMMGMMQLKSSEPETCHSTQNIMDDENLWFRRILNEDSILRNLKTIETILRLPCVKTRNWIFDDSERLIDC